VPGLESFVGSVTTLASVPTPDESPAREPRTVPRPPDAAPGRPAPWCDVAASARQGIGLAQLTAALERADRDLARSAPREPLDELSGLPASVTDGLRNSAVLVALFEEDGEARCILTRRSGTLRRHRGEVSFPGGRVEPHEAPLAAALREAHEEVGLHPSDLRPFAWLRPLVTFASGSLIRPFVASLASRPVLTLEPAEVERAFDVSIAELVADGVFHEERWRRPSPRANGADGEFPIAFFEIDGEVVWGATARILTELCSLVMGVPLR
jgi:8-oxo-dGTP pyrophosphatase MutT (NUDIX family)